MSDAPENRPKLPQHEMRIVFQASIFRWWFHFLFFEFAPRSLQKSSNLTSTFFKWVGSTTNSSIFRCKLLLVSGRVLLWHSTSVRTADKKCQEKKNLFDPSRQVPEEESWHGVCALGMASFPMLTTRPLVFPNRLNLPNLLQYIACFWVASSTISGEIV